MAVEVTANIAYDDYLEAVIINQVKYMNWRLGQTAFNTLAQLRPDLAETIRGTEADPFYADNLPAGYQRVANFLAYVREEW